MSEPKASRFKRGPVTQRILIVNLIGGLVGGALLGWLWGQLWLGIGIGAFCGVAFALIVGDDAANAKTQKDQAGSDQETPK